MSPLSHHGAHHIAGMLLALRGYKVAGVRDRHEGGLRRYVQDRLDRLYPEFQRMRVLFSDSYPRDIFRCYRDGYAVGSAMDVNRARSAGQKTETVTVFGEERAYLTGPLQMALRCKAPALQAFIVAKSRFRYHLDIVATLIDPETVTDEDAAVSEAMRAYAANIETHLRATPTLITKI